MKSQTKRKTCSKLFWFSVIIAVCAILLTGWVYSKPDKGYIPRTWKTKNVNNKEYQNARVAIIGGGAGASSSAYHLQKVLGDRVQIELFEKNSYFGGRVASGEIAGEHVEFGGSIYHIENKIFHDLVKEGNFRTFNPVQDHSDPKVAEIPNYREGESLMGVWDGKEFRFVEHTNFYLNVLSGLWRYSISPHWVSKAADKVLKQFLNIYQLLEEDSYDTIGKLLSELELLELTQVSLEKFLFDGGYCGIWDNDGAFCHEIVTGLTRVNYGQSMDLNALVGLIALIGSTDDVRGVVGGNKQVLEFAIQQSKAVLHKQATVRSVSKNIEGKYIITYVGADGSEHTSENFDKVIIATPLEFANITFSGIDIDKRAQKEREYQLTHVSLVVGDLALESYFNQPKGTVQPQGIITTENPALNFTSVFLKSDINGKGERRNLYKIFSRVDLSPTDVDQIVTNITELYQTKFYAYPVLHPHPDPAEFPPFLIDSHGIYYVNAMESAFSTIETEMISGKNIANLIARSLEK